MPAYLALSPSSSSMRRRRLYLATRSERQGAPVLIWPVLNPTLKSLMVVSSVSPERWLTTEVQPALLATSMAECVSVRVPIWFNFIRTELLAFRLMPLDIL